MASVKNQRCLMGHWQKREPQEWSVEEAESTARCSGREASVHAPLRAAPDTCNISARDVLADPRTDWRRGLADGCHSRASGRGHLHSRN